MATRSLTSKRVLAAFAALQILLYHCWIPVFKFGSAAGNVERFLIGTSYVGVDVFFFLSGYSLAKRPVDDYSGFIKNRAAKLLPMFIIALLFKKFLWFIPSLMIVYIAYVPLQRWIKRTDGEWKRWVWLLLLLIGWAEITGALIAGLRLDLGIFLFRIPIVLAGAFSVRFVEWLTDRFAISDDKWRRLELVFGLAMLAIGTMLLYKFGYLNKANAPLRGIFYLAGIPSTLGIVVLIDLIVTSIDVSDGGIAAAVINGFGGATLELYFWQMMLGGVLTNIFFGYFGSKLATNLATMLVVIAAACLTRLVTR